MPFRTPTVYQAIRLAVLLAAASSLALANQSPLPSSTKPLCYCNCGGAGSHLCTMMCELPQYENRWWATSCHKKAAAPPAKPAAPETPTTHSRTNHIEEAQLR